jgi:hypothetical protein
MLQQCCSIQCLQQPGTAMFTVVCKMLGRLSLICATSRRYPKTELQTEF